MAPTICLNMIVKNEAHVIRRSLASVLPIIDHWVIVDTGSTDGTQDIIREELRDIPGTLFERPWRNFGHNRSEAIELAARSADYLLFLDADDELSIAPDFDKASLSATSYRVLLQHNQNIFWRPALASTKLNWRFVGVLHEYLDSDMAHAHAKLRTLRVIERREGGRSRGLSAAEKYARDARTLEEALRHEPGNARYVFYLAQSYRDAGQPQKALKTYQRRADMGGWVEEVWYSLYQVARLSEQMKLAPAVITQRYLEAYGRRPRRAEPLVELARWYRERKDWALAHLCASRAICIPVPEDLLFVEAATYAWRAIDEFAVASYWMGDFKACEAACNKLLATPSLPPAQLARVSENLRLAREKLSA